MNLFSKSETKVILFILFCLFAVTGYNISISLRRGRDSIRKNDISAIQKSIDTYYQKYRVFPLSTDKGEIIGCFSSEPVTDKETGKPTNVEVCRWGESRFENNNLMPRDPKYKDGASYKYLSLDGKTYEFYIALEGKDEDEYTPAIVSLNLNCGIKVCNYGRRN